MKISQSLVLALPALVAAFPGMAPRDEMENQLRDMYHAEKREAEATAEANPQLLGTLLGDVKGLLGSVASAVDPSNKRPEPGYNFIAPGPGDSRGPCPGKLPRMAELSEGDRN